jgi:hypothetical protein
MAKRWGQQIQWVGVVFLRQTYPQTLELAKGRFDLFKEVVGVGCWRCVGKDF